MQFFQLLTSLIMCLTVSSTAQTSTSSEIREFIRTTSLMTKLGVRIATSLSTKNKKSKLGLLLGIKPSSLVLVPEEFEFNKNNIPHLSPRARLIPIDDRIHDLKLVCYNQKVRKHFPEWGIVELCKGESHEIFAAYMLSLSRKRARLAVSRGDLEDAPIIELGMLRCMRLHGPCSSPRPNDMELASILASVEGSLVLITSSTESAKTSVKEVPTHVEEFPSTATLVITITSIFHVQSISSKADGFDLDAVKTSSQYQSSLSEHLTSKIGPDKITPVSNFNTLDKPPSYSENPVSFEAYRSRLKAKTTSSSKTWPGVVWVKIPAKTTTSSITMTSILTTTLSAVLSGSIPTSYYQVTAEDVDNTFPCKTPILVSTKLQKFCMI